MIEVFSGTPGSGKSLHAANEIRFQLNRPSPRPVLANFVLASSAPVKRRELFAFVPNEHISPGLLVDFANDFWSSSGLPFREDYITLVVDECQILFNARNWGSSGRLEFLEFLSQHRKYGYHIILIAQNMAMIDNQFRMLVDFDVNHRNVKNFPGIGGFLGLVTRGRAFLQVTYLCVNGKTKERVGSRWYIGRRKDMEMYDSYARFNAFPLAESSGSLINAEKPPVLKFGISLDERSEVGAGGCA